MPPTLSPSLRYPVLPGEGVLSDLPSCTVVYIL
jgi:hypothetical protein